MIDAISVQELVEERYSRKHIDAKIKEEVLKLDLDPAVELVNEFLSKSYYESKNIRLAQLANIEVLDLVVDMLIGVAYSQKEELFSSVCAQMAARLKFSDKAAAVTTVAELLAVLCQTDLFDITKADKMASLMLVSKIPLSKSVVEFINNSQYLPPMVCEPLEVTHNFNSGYLTHNDSLILGTGNHHDGDLCLDVINIINTVKLSLDTEFLSNVEEEPSFELDTPEKMDAWLKFKRQSYDFYKLMYKYGNKFYLTNKVDKRGRIYASGFHINTQGGSFKRACIELYKKEIVEL